MTAALLRVCTLRYEMQFVPASERRTGEFKRAVATAQLYGADKNGLFIEREDAERCANTFQATVINEVEVPPDYNGEQDHA